MSDKQFSRRNALKALGAAGASMSLAGCISSNPFGKSELQKELDALQPFVDKYDGSVKKAFKDGYHAVMGPYVTGMGWHVMNPKKLQKQVKNGYDITDPPLINFDMDGNLGSVEWAAPAEAVSKSPNIFSDENVEATEKWSVHQSATHVFANANGKQDSIREQPLDEILTNTNWGEVNPPNPNLKPGDEVKLKWGAPTKRGDESFNSGFETEKRVADFVQTHPDLVGCHVWVGVDNPNGLFTPFNPEFAQEIQNDSY